MNPPLRSERDRRALVAALQDGTLDSIATDHAPHAGSRRSSSSTQAAFGIVGFETALGTLGRLVEAGELDWPLVVEKLTVGPARVFDLPHGTLAPGAAGRRGRVRPRASAGSSTPAEFASKGRNSPLDWSDAASGG